MKRISICFCFVFVTLSLHGCNPPETTSETGTERSQSNGDAIDLIVLGDYVISMDANDTVIKDGAVAIDDGVIIAIASADKITATYSAQETMPGDRRIVMPGLINGHSHAAMTLLRGVADDLALMDWLNNYIFPAEVAFVDAEFVRIGQSSPAGK